MNDREKNLQHAMMSFALWGGMLVGNRPPRQSPLQLRPVPLREEGLVSRKPRSRDRGFCFGLRRAYPARGGGVCIERLAGTPTVGVRAAPAA